MRSLRVPAAVAVTIIAAATPIAGIVSWGCHHDGPGPENDALLRGADARGRDGGMDGPRDSGHPVDAGSNDAGTPADAAVDAPLD
jgi:hypothetical protein